MAREDTETPFSYRIALGWVERISSVPFQRFSQNLDSKWTARCEISNRLVQDYGEYFGFMRETQLNCMVLWGLFGENWPDPKKGIPPERAKKIRTILDYAHDCRVKLLLGFSPQYGMTNIINESPEMALVSAKGEKSRTSICPSKPESERWVKNLLTYFLSDFDIDGFSLEPIGRCHCDDCREVSDMDYYRLGYPRTISSVRDNFPGKTFLSYFPEIPFADKENSGYLKETNELSNALDVGCRTSPEVLESYDTVDLKVALRNYASGATWITPPWSWDRLRWFLPQTVQEMKSIKEAYKLGAVGYTWSCAPLANPGVEITTRFRASLLLNPAQDGRECLEEVLRGVYEPKTERALTALVATFQEAERAYPWNALPKILHAESFSYLSRLSKEELTAYGKTIKNLLDALRRAEEEIGAREKAEDLLTCLGKVMKDIESPPAYPREVQLRLGTISARGRE